ncbi:MAG: hypothetical protein NTW32_19265, partial [Chloroflexi bacterium]|nr:hypothetical protein [Chloroflexota bacterium]
QQLPETSPESSRANTALRDYCHIGSIRTLEKLIGTYIHQPDAPTHSLNTLKKWSITYAWAARVFAFDEIQRSSDNLTFAQRRRSIVESGLSLKHERIEKLKLAYAQLEPYLTQPDFIWPRQVKKLPTTGGGFELIETRRFNAEIFTQIRGILADIARETNSLEPSNHTPGPFTALNLTNLTRQELEILEKVFSRPAPDPHAE